MPFERGLDDAALDAHPAAVHEPHFTQAGATENRADPRVQENQRGPRTSLPGFAPVAASFSRVRTPPTIVAR